MTIICWDGQTLAADSRLSMDRDIVTDSFNKIHSLKGFTYLEDPLLAMGTSGDAIDVERFLMHLGKADNHDESVTHKVYAIIIGTYSVYESYANNSYLLRYDRDTKLSVGCGWVWGASAMALGLDAVQAVKHAIAHNAGCGGRVRKWRA